LATARVLKRPTCPILLRRTIWTGWQLHWLVFHSFQGWQKAQRLRAFDTLGQDDEDGELWDGNDNEARNCQSVRAQVCSSNQMYRDEITTVSQRVRLYLYSLSSIIHMYMLETATTQRYFINSQHGNHCCARRKKARLVLMVSRCVKW
jgi:hypothetical protein